MTRGPYKFRVNARNMSTAGIIATKYALHNPATGGWRNGSDTLAYALDKSNADWFVMEYDIMTGWKVVADPRKRRMAANA